MFKTAAAAQIDDKSVIVIRQIAKYLYRLRSIILIVSAASLSAIIISFAGKYISMRFALRGKFLLEKIADFKRRIIQNVKIFCTISSDLTSTGRNFIQTRRYFPISKRFDRYSEGAES